MENQTKEISSWGSGQKTGGGQINIKKKGVVFSRFG